MHIIDSVHVGGHAYVYHGACVDFRGPQAGVGLFFWWVLRLLWVLRIEPGLSSRHLELLRHLTGSLFLFIVGV